MSSISPDSCPPDVPYWVLIPGVDGETVGQRVDPRDHLQWSVIVVRSESENWYKDHEVTVLRPVGEQLPDWEILRRAHDIAKRDKKWPTEDPILVEIADRLEAEHKAEQVKAERQAKLEELIYSAAEVAYDADSKIGAVTYADDLKPYMQITRALADAGYLKALCDD